MRELCVISGLGVSLAEALSVMEEFGGGALDSGRREGMSGVLSELPGSLTGGVEDKEQGLWSQVGLGSNPSHYCFIEALGKVFTCPSLSHFHLGNRSNNNTPFKRLLDII